MIVIHFCITSSPEETASAHSVDVKGFFSADGSRFVTVDELQRPDLAAAMVALYHGPVTERIERRSTAIPAR